MAKKTPQQEIADSYRPPHVRRNLYFSRRLWQKLERIALQQRIPPEMLAVQAIRDFVQNYERSTNTEKKDSGEEV